jgi:phosphate starvation-inducible PhoH-like protein
LANIAPTIPHNKTTKPETLLNFPDNNHLIDLCGPLDRNLTQIETTFDVQIARRGNDVAIMGAQAAQAKTAVILNTLYARAEQGKPVEPGDIDAAIRFADKPPETSRNPADQMEMFKGGRLEIRTRKKTVEPRTVTQKAYVEDLLSKELTFGLGPAGTGKTYLAVAAAVSMFISGLVDKIILSRPAVEAGERLGFLPGDMKEKVDPYMQPLYDALNDYFPAKQVEKLIEDKRIEIAPLAFMRGRTLSNAYVVLDEAQNATTMQMKMFLTRMGEGSYMAITGDPSQIDLPRNVPSGLVEAEKVLCNVKGIGFTYFKTEDIVRHAMVAKIITAYDKHAKSNG